ncbi:hypothetical protein GEMRC1_012504 [Eukaryota sp. GEM-RC1]
MALKDFRIIKTVGKGSFGQVYRANRLSDGQEVAIKEVDIKSMSSRERESSLKEVKILASVSHPHIIAYRQAWIEDDKLFIVTEYASGGDLHGLIQKQLQKQRLLHEDIIWRYVIEAVLALRHMHEKRIIHRDLKPQNILLDNRGHLKVADLGLGRVMSEQTLLVHTRVGTPYYISPELIRGDGYDEMSDVYALGAVFYELCALKPPFRVRNNNIIALQNKIVNDRPADLHDYYSAELKFLVFKMLEKQPQNRPSLNHILNYSEVKIRMKELEWKKKEKQWKTQMEDMERKFKQQIEELQKGGAVSDELAKKAAQYTPLVTENKKLRSIMEEAKNDKLELEQQLQQLKLHRQSDVNPQLIQRMRDLEEEREILALRIQELENEGDRPSTPQQRNEYSYEDIYEQSPNPGMVSVLDGQLAMWKTGAGPQFVKQKVEDDSDTTLEATPPTPFKEKGRNEPRSHLFGDQPSTSSESDPSSSISYNAVSEGQLEQFTLDFLRVCRSSDAKNLPSMVAVFHWSRKSGDTWDPCRRCVLLQPSSGVTFLYRTDPRDYGNVEALTVRESGDRKYKALSTPLASRLTSTTSECRNFSFSVPSHVLSSGTLTHFVLDFEDNEAVREVFAFRVYPEINAFIR